MAKRKRRIYPLALTLIGTSLIGLVAALALTLEKLAKLANPDTLATCDFSLVIQCGKNLDSWQGSILGFPNPIIGLVLLPLVLATGVGLFARAYYAKWYWRTFHIGVTLAFGFVLWLIYQSVYVLGTLCPWCMVTWSAVIPMFWATTFWVFKRKVWTYNKTAIMLGKRLYLWTPTFTVATYVIIAVLAQLQLDWISYL